MAKKPRSFMDKITKARQKGKDGKDLLHHTKLVSMHKSDKGNWKFSEKMVAVTSKNKNEIMGS